MISYPTAKYPRLTFFFLQNYVYKTKLQVHKMFIKYSFSSCFIRYQHVYGSYILFAPKTLRFRLKTKRIKIVIFT